MLPTAEALWRPCLFVYAQHMCTLHSTWSPGRVPLVTAGAQWLSQCIDSPGSLELIMVAGDAKTAAGAAAAAAAAAATAAATAAAAAQIQNCGSQLMLE